MAIITVTSTSQDTAPLSLPACFTEEQHHIYVLPQHAINYHFKISPEDLEKEVREELMPRTTHAVGFDIIVGLYSKPWHFVVIYCNAEYDAHVSNCCQAREQVFEENRYECSVQLFNYTLHEEFAEEKEEYDAWKNAERVIEEMVVKQLGIQRQLAERRARAYTKRVNTLARLRRERNAKEGLVRTLAAIVASHPALSIPVVEMPEWDDIGEVDEAELYGEYDACDPDCTCVHCTYNLSPWEIQRRKDKAAKEEYGVDVTDAEIQEYNHSTSPYRQSW